MNQFVGDVIFSGTHENSKGMMWLDTFKSHRPSIAVWGKQGLRITHIVNSYEGIDLNCISYREFKDMKQQRPKELQYSKKFFSIEGNVSCIAQSSDNRYLAISIDNDINIVEFNRVNI